MSTPPINIAPPDVRLREYEVLLDGVIELPDLDDNQAFFAGLLETIIAYAEQHHASVAMRINYHKNSMV
jgi:hypothetical protein